MKYVLLTILFFTFAVRADAKYSAQEKQALLAKVKETRGMQRQTIQSHIKKFRQMHHLRQRPQMTKGERPKLNKVKIKKIMIRKLKKRRRRLR